MVVENIKFCDLCGKRPRTGQVFAKWLVCETCFQREMAAQMCACGHIRGTHIDPFGGCTGYAVDPPYDGAAGGEICGCTAFRFPPRLRTLTCEHCGQSFRAERGTRWCKQCWGALETAQVGASRIFERSKAVLDGTYDDDPWRGVNGKGVRR